MKPLFARIGDSALPDPLSETTTALTEMLVRRRSVREFSGVPLCSHEISQLCWAGQGYSSQEGLRTAPSAGAIYPLTLLIADAEGVSEYIAKRHSLRQISDQDVRPRLQAAALDQPCVGDAPCCLVIAADIDRMALKYGPRAERYCYLEAGHVAQNVLLMATELGLGCVPIGAFADNAVSSVLGLKSYVQPVYLLPVGHPL